ncbi:MAG TPA: homocysteine S-methyltransferase family protein [Myxococcota bacterium]|nr:homocysteine S-methyltransferase family protein [Myxococcota bacterium]
MRLPSVILSAARERVVVIDGAMGTEIQKAAPTAADFGPVDGLNEMLCLTRPDMIAGIHRAFLDAGADIVETNSFGANRIVLEEYGVADRAAELSLAAAEIARKAADRASAPGRPRWVSGSIGPGSRLPSLGQVEPEAMLDAYHEQGAALLAGGVDMFQVETCQDPLQARLAVLGLRRAMDDSGREVPIFAQVTVDGGGRMLLGTDVIAALATLSSMPGVAVFGLNCSTGPDAMYGVLKRLAGESPLPLAALPNAGLPENDGGRLVYRLTPAGFAAQVRSFVTELGVSFVGGCCGTSPEHIRALAEAVADLEPSRNRSNRLDMLSSLFSAVAMEQTPGPLIIGERTNANGSRAFRNHLVDGNVDAMLQVGRDQVDEGAHVLDICLAVAGRDEPADVVRFVPVATRFLDAAVMVDSTEPAAIEAALMRCPGRAVVNSVNLEDGGMRLDVIAGIARRHGAAVVALTIDEIGMAMTAARKVEVASRLIGLLVDRHGFDPADIFVDPLTFTMASGDAALRTSALETINATRMIRARHPGVRISLGVSNCSYGLNPGARRVLNSVMLDHCMKAGLDAAIVNASRIMPVDSIPEALRLAADALINNDSSGGRDPLHSFIEMFEEGASAGAGADDVSSLSPVQRCRRAVIRGDRIGLDATLDILLGEMDALQIINDVLLDAMREVGEMFGSGRMQLPFVLRSAEVMKTAVDMLRPHLPAAGTEPRGTLVIATVVGDVHDIGKNLVDIIVSNNGFRVVNLGVKRTVEEIMAAARRENADAIGMSGLLVKSTMAMKDNLQVMERAGVRLPVLVGGAALDGGFVERELRTSYSGQVYYCRDAFEGLRALNQVVNGQRPLS